MKRLLLSLLAGAGFTLLSLSAQAQFTYQVTNFTLSGGDPTFPITDDVTFTNLVLNESFQDSSTQTISLFDPADPTHTATNTLDTGVFNLFSDTTAYTDPTHGRVSSATLAGTFDLTTLGIQTSFGGPITNVTVSPNFSTTLDLTQLTTGSQLVFANIFAVDAASGARYGAGTLAASGVPEPGSLALLAAGGLSMAAVWRRRAKRA